MSGFEDIITKLRERDAQNENSDMTVYDDLTTEYNHLKENGLIALQAKEDQLSTLQTEMMQLKARNYELLVSGGGNTRNKMVDGSPENAGFGEEPPDEDDIGIDELLARAFRETK